MDTLAPSWRTLPFSYAPSPRQLMVIVVMGLAAAAIWITRPVGTALAAAVILTVMSAMLGALALISAFRLGATLHWARAIWLRTDHLLGSRDEAQFAAADHFVICTRMGPGQIIFATMDRDTLERSNGSMSGIICNAFILYSSTAVINVRYGEAIVSMSRSVNGESKPRVDVTLEASEMLTTRHFLRGGILASDNDYLEIAGIIAAIR